MLKSESICCFYSITRIVFYAQAQIVLILLAKHQLFQELRNEIIIHAVSIAQPITVTINRGLNGIWPTQNTRRAVS